MANFDTIKTAIDANIKTNGTQDITGGKMNSILHQMVDATDEQLTELESEKKSFVYELIGKDKNAVFAKFKLKQGIPYIISTPELWDVSELMNNTFFSVGYYNGDYNDVIHIDGKFAHAYKRAYVYTQNEECEYTYVQIKAAKGVVVPITISELGNNISLVSDITPNIDSTTGIIDLGADPNLFIGGAVFISTDMKNHRNIPIQTEGGFSQDSGRRKLWYNIITGFFGTYNYDMALSDEEVLIGSISVEYSSTGAYKGILKDVNLPFEYTIDKEYKDKTNVQTIISQDFNIPSHSYQVIGDGNNGIMIKFLPKKGVNYAITTKRWAYSELTEGNNGFTYGYYDGSYHDMFVLPVKNLDSLKECYNVTFDNDFEYCYVFLRANKGEIVNINISDAKIYEGALQNIGIGFTASGNELPNINTTQKTLDLGADPVIYVGKEYYAFASIFPNNTEYYRAIPIYEENNPTGAVKLIFNLSTKRIYAKGAAKTLALDELVIGGIRLIYKTHDFVSANLPFEYTIDGKSSTQIESAKTQREYSGERPNLPRYYKFNTLLSFSEVGEYDREIDSQGMDIYANKYLFQGSNPRASESTNYNNIYVIDLESKTLLGGFEYKKNSHVNTLNCGAKYADSDTYPLLYASECYYEHGCDVIRLNNDLSSYQSIQRISYVGSQHFSGWTAYDWTIDVENSFIYAFGTNNGFTQILKFALPLPTSGNVEFTDDDILDVFEFDGAYIYQGAKVIGNQMFIPFGYGNTQYPAYINVFDISRKEVVSHIPLEGFGETEAVALYKGNLVIVNNSTNPTYREIEL